MNAVEFLNEGTRMCNSYEACVGCPMYPMDDCCMVRMNLKQMINIVEQWAKEHPVKTRQSEFLKQWPNAELDCEGVITIDPCEIDKTMYGKYKGCSNGDCGDCSRDFWLAEIE